MAPEVGEILISAQEIAGRVRELGALLAREYAGREPVLVAVMKGSVVFLADLVRAWPGPLDLEFVSAESYQGTQAGGVRLVLPQDLGSRVAGQPVVVVDDIYDTGATLEHVCEALRALGPADLRTLVLLRKRLPPEARRGRGRPDWVGFEIENRFVIGYGLDYHGRYRNLPYLAVLGGA
ncbi:MAG: phosphoribosyltransferase family protein [Planctomycetota bacterium]|nr:phosphoribosyltransferase family protein [Planctomycetota bacterium]